MLRSSSFGISLFINVIIIALWHFLSFIIIFHLPGKYFDDTRAPFRIRDIENRGKFYDENFVVQLWYRSLPGCPIKTDLSDSSMSGFDLQYLNTLLLLTCRVELSSIVNCMYFVCAWILDAPYLAFILSAIVIIANIPYIMCARYSRCIILNTIIKKRKEQAQKDRETRDALSFTSLNFHY